VRFETTPEFNIHMLKSRIVIFFIIFVLTVVYVGGCRRAGAWLVVDNLPVHADALVILMGSIRERVPQAADLYCEGRANRIIIVEENQGRYAEIVAKGTHIISTTERARRTAVELGIPPDSIIILKGDSRSTMDEAVTVRQYLDESSAADTLLIVTSAHHTRRAAMIFKAALKDTVEQVVVFCSPSKYTGFDASEWWHRRDGIQSVLSEYLKILNFILIEKRKV
jgi:uncharacterized SAM-binding protein YcdF (DUF218 family)